MFCLDLKSLIKELHQNEKKLLICLKAGKKKDIEELETSSGLEKNSLMNAAMWLSSKKLAEIEEKINEYYSLKEEGEKYAKNGLPEKLMLNALAELKKAPLDELSKKANISNPNIALGWMKKNGWIEFEGKNISLTEKGLKDNNKTSDSEKLLKILEPGTVTGPDVAELKSTLDTLVKRGLVQVREKTTRTALLTKLGMEAISTGIEITEEINVLTPKIIKSKKWKTTSFRPYNTDAPAPPAMAGRRHYMYEALEFTRQIWLEMGFTEMTGPMADSSFWVFDSLYIPQDHPGREMQDTFFLKNPEKITNDNKELVKKVHETHEKGGNMESTGWNYKWSKSESEKPVLRTHTTSLSARTLASLSKKDLPAKFFSVGRVFRNETIDWSHLAEFYQVEGIVVDENASFKHLLGYLKRFFSKLGFPQARFRPAYFPYTEMSVEIEVFHPKKQKWLELGGAGIFRPEVVVPLLGEDIPVLAWGPGFERMVIDVYNIDSLKQLYSNDLEETRNAFIWPK
ncbi:MAG: phenylalanine--tRNA ligase subunit alpha [Candidatus Diapherotrites archaeon]|nr:phenylalanine--tRNA ligase subunit alpha [Candidatus Diapherotrites archaeon]